VALGASLSQAFSSFASSRHSEQLLLSHYGSVRTTCSPFYVSCADLLGN
jgi:hypothetical protein